MSDDSTKIASFYACSAALCEPAVILRSSRHLPNTPLRVYYYDDYSNYHRACFYDRRRFTTTDPVTSPDERRRQITVPGTLVSAGKSDRPNTRVWAFSTRTNNTYLILCTYVVVLVANNSI